MEPQKDTEGQSNNGKIKRKKKQLKFPDFLLYYKIIWYWHEKRQEANGTELRPKKNNPSHI